MAALFSPGGATSPSSGRTTNEISYLQPLENLTSEQLIQLLEERHVATDDCLSGGELRARAAKHNLGGMLHVGQAAIVAKAREMLVVMSRLDREIAFRPGLSWKRQADALRWRRGTSPRLLVVTMAVPCWSSRARTRR